MSSTDATTGDKYNANLSTKEIAVLIRADIKAAVKAGTLPKGKYSVRISSGSMYSAIDIRISDLAMQVFNEERLESDLLDPHSFVPEHMCPRYTAAAKSAKDTCEAIMGAYNHNRSDSMVDHFDVKFYGHADFCGTWERAKRAEELRGWGLGMQRVA